MTADQQPDDRLCLITGATGGLGSALAVAFRAAGYHPVCSARNAKALAALVDRLDQAGGATALSADLRSPSDIESLGERLAALPGRLDVVVSNAGEAVDCSVLAAREPLARWRDMVLVNVFGAAAVARVTLPALVTSGGSLFFIGSIMGRTTAPGDLYSVTKHAVAALAETVRMEAESHGVQVCVVHPGLMATPMVAKARRNRPMLHPRHVAAEVVRAAQLSRVLRMNELVIRPADPTMGNLNDPD